MNPPLPPHDPLHRLLRAAAAGAPPQQDAGDHAPPFGFETRVLAAVRASRRHTDAGVFGSVFRKALASAAAVMLLTLGFGYDALADYASLFGEPDAAVLHLADNVAPASLAD